MPIVAKCDIQPNSEVIVSYGENYWQTIDQWRRDGPPVKKASDVARDERAFKRSRK